MQAVDRETIASGVSGEILMARASRKLAGELLFFADSQPRPLVIFCGPGNNGGDGLGLAVYLHQWGWPVEVWLCVPEESIQGDALIFYQRVKAESILCRSVLSEEDWQRAEIHLPANAWLVDALLGTGSKGAPRNNMALAVNFISRERSGHFVWSVDLPSGLDAESGLPFDENCCVQADHCLTLGGAKKGFQIDASVRWTGSISVLDLGFEDALLLRHVDGDSAECMSDREAAEALPSFPGDAHKGSRGHLLLAGGSLGMTGAISLSARAALRGGCGLVTVLTPFSCAQIVDAAVPEAMVIHGKQGKFMGLSNQEVNFSCYQAVGMGPGMRINYDSSEFLARVLKECTLPMVLDADALNAFALLDSVHRETRAPLWLTPHPGEMARLLRWSGAQVQHNREEAVEAAMNQFAASTLLNEKGNALVVGEIDNVTRRVAVESIRIRFEDRHGKPSF